MSRRVVSTLFASVDGVVSDPHEWQFDSFDDGLADLMGRQLPGVTDGLLGRRTYDMWAGYWSGAGASDPFADFINPLRKHVASRTLAASEVTWQNASLIEGDLLAYVSELKASGEGDIAVEGSISIVRQLVAAGLMDALTLVIHPVIAGEGVRLFDADFPRTRLELLASETTSKGNVIATYGPRA